MKREELARQLANRRHISRAQASDELDQVVHRILTSLRQGEAADVPGVGQLKAEPVKAEPVKAEPVKAERKPAPLGKKSKA